MKAAQQGTDNERVEMTFVWRCACGVKNFNHHDWCSYCTANRPSPSDQKDQKGKK